MLKSLVLGSAILIAAPVLAQTVAAPAPANAADPAAAATPSATAQQPTAAATPATSATPAAQAAPAATSQPSNSADAVAAVVAADWAKYDTSGKGELTKAEFGKWMDALREQNPAQKAAVKDPAAWTSAAFAKADKDKNGSISKTELETFLRG